MGKVYLTFIVALICFVGNCQDSFYDHVELGPYSIGFCDSIIYDDEIQYNQYGYRGKAPIFLQIWFPALAGPNQKFMALGDYRSQDIPKELNLVYAELCKQMDASYIRDGITYDLTSDNPIDYGSKTYWDILDKIKSQKTRSIQASLPADIDYPVIVYHHGSQGMSDENSIMAEYFASRGYIFISANFHLPYPNTPFGLLPYHLEKESKHDQSTAKKVIQFARSITTHENAFFIGHSWGAQEGWCFLHDKTLTNGFVSMETTIEFKTDSMEIKDKWPYVYDAIKTKRNKFSIPILLFAANEDNTNFDFFKDSGTKMICASYKQPFAHNSYTSFYMTRYFLRDEIKQPDEEILLSQIKGYASHVEFIYGFLERIRTKKKLDLTKFQELFQIEQEWK